MKILFLSRWFPYPVDNGSKLRIYNLLRGLAQQHDVTLISFTDQPEVTSSAPEITSICAELHIVPWREFDPKSMHARLGFLRFVPRSIIDTFSAEMAQVITRVLNARHYDLVIASQLPMAAYHSYFHGLPALFEELELGLSSENSQRVQHWKNRFRHALTWGKLRIYLSRLLKYFKAVTVVSEKERELAVRKFPGVKKISVIPNCLNLADYRDIHAEQKSNRLIFTGSFRYHANYEAMVWFVNEVFPLILDQIPDAELIITGDDSNLPLPAVSNITRMGFVEDIRSLIASSAVAVAPILSGGGTRLKILEAMAIGTPVVATSKGAEGLGAQNSEHLFVADDPIHFSDCVIELLNNRGLRRNMAKEAKLFVQTKYDWANALPDFLNLVQSIVIDRNARDLS